MNGANAPGPCPRCGGGFICGFSCGFTCGFTRGRDGAAPCPCTGVTLDAATLAGLRRQYSGCLCLDCLRTLAQDDTTVVRSQGDSRTAGDPQGSLLVLQQGPSGLTGGAGGAARAHRPL